MTAERGNERKLPASELKLDRYFWWPTLSLQRLDKPVLQQQGNPSWSEDKSLLIGMIGGQIRFETRWLIWYEFSPSDCRKHRLICNFHQCNNNCVESSTYNDYLSPSQHLDAVSPLKIWYRTLTMLVFLYWCSGTTNT